MPVREGMSIKGSWLSVHTHDNQWAESSISLSREPTKEEIMSDMLLVSINPENQEKASGLIHTLLQENIYFFLGHFKLSQCNIFFKIILNSCTK